MEQVKGKNRKIRALQSTVIFIIMVIFTICILVIFRTEIKGRAEQNVKDDLEEFADRYADKLADRMDIVNVLAGETMYYSEVFAQDSAGIIQLANGLTSTGEIDRVWFIDADGNITDQAGCDVDPGSQEGIKVLEAASGTKNVLYCDEDIDERFVLTAVSSNGNGQLLKTVAGISTSEFTDILHNAGKNIVALLMVTDASGNIICSDGGTSVYTEKTNIWENFSDNKDDSSLTRLKDAVSIGGNGYGEISVGSEKKTFVTAPIGETGNSFIVAVNNSVKENLVSLEWKKSRQMIKLLIFNVLFFLFLHTAALLHEWIKASGDKKKLEEKADTDLLTGLNNKLATERKIREFMETNENTPGLLIIIDIDDFKKINDTKGHAFGDEVLRELGAGLSSQFRYTDIVGRVGGDEFMVFLKNIEGRDTIMREAGKLIRFFDDFKAGTEYIKYSASASIGAACFPSEGKNFETLYKAADSALYRSKKNGKKQLNFYNEDWETVKV